MYARVLAGLALAAIASIAIYAFLLEPNNPVVEEVVVESPEIPEELAGFRIVQLSDLHLHGIGPREAKSLELVRELEPHLIVVTGDLLDDPAYLKAVLQYIGELGEIAPVLVVYGNWDHWAGVDLGELEKALESTGSAEVLVNEAVSPVEGLVVAGVDDPHTGRADLGRALRGVREGDFVVLLAHSPEILGRAAGRVDLVLAGHTHGGQVVLPLLGPIFLPVPPEYRQYASGTFRINGTVVHVSRGLGTSAIPVRFLCPPEVTLVVLERG